VLSINALSERTFLVMAASRSWLSVRFAVVASIVLVAIGCGGPPQADYSKVNLVSVEGTVTLDGTPLPNAVITFENPDDGMFAYAMTDASGSYELRFDSVMMGCTPGTKIVRISTTRRILGLNAEEGGGEGEGELGEEEIGEESADGGVASASSSRVEQVPEKYNRESELTVEVAPGSEHYDFDLVSG
jgi:hypothetical protein